MMEKIVTIGVVFFTAAFFAKAETISYSYFRSGRTASEATKDERALYVDFELKTRENEQEPEIRSHNTKNPIEFRNFNPERETIILISGSNIFGRGYTFYYYSFLSYAFLRNGDYNVISVHWDELTDLNLMRYTLHNAVFVGELTTALINSLGKNNETIGNFSIVGHHYGTISAAVVGALLEGKLKRIMALDPQIVPLNIRLPHWAHLDRLCAKVVEVVHTSTYNIALGHRDFYVNGGRRPQPGCELDFFGFCSSEHAFIVYGTDVIYSGKRFNATNCQSYDAYLSHKCKGGSTVSLWNGENSNSVPTGSYFITTSAIPLPPEIRRSIGGRKQYASYSHGAKHVLPFDQ